MRQVPDPLAVCRGTNMIFFFSPFVRVNGNAVHSVRILKTVTAFFLLVQSYRLLRPDVGGEPSRRPDFSWWLAGPSVASPARNDPQTTR
jgi:hypothetical protein